MEIPHRRILPVRPGLLCVPHDAGTATPPPAVMTVLAFPTAPPLAVGQNRQTQPAQSAVFPVARRNLNRLHLAGFPPLLFDDRVGGHSP